MPIKRRRRYETKRKPPTPEEREAFILKQLSENPKLTREQIEAWDKMGRPAKPGEMEALLDRLYQEELEKGISRQDPTIPGLEIL